MTIEKFVFKNRRLEREYSFENVFFFYHVRGQKTKILSGVLKEQLFKSLLTKNRISIRTTLETDRFTFGIKEFDFSKWDRIKKGEYLKEERFYIDLWMAKEK